MIKTRRVLRALGFTALGAGAAATAIFAAGTILGFKPPAPTKNVGSSYIRVVVGTVSQTAHATVRAQWQSTVGGYNRASGIVTTTSLQPGSMLEAGQVVYSVDLRPVVVAEGSIPAFRDLHSPMSGPDVEQLQGLLRKIGLTSKAPSGVFDASTTRSVRQWQTQLGVTPDGTVRASDIIFTTGLPYRATLGSVLSVGAQLSGTEPALTNLGVEPMFRIAISDQLAGNIESGQLVTITRPSGGTWVGTIGPPSQPTKSSESNEVSADSNQPTFDMVPTEGETSICLDTCQDIQLGNAQTLAASIQTVRPIHGAVIPTAALMTEPGGDAIVRLKSGKSVPVQVIGSAAGQSVVTGIAVGRVIKVPASSS